VLDSLKSSCQAPGLYEQIFYDRPSINGEPLYYYAIACRKNADVPMAFLESKGVDV